MPIAKYPNASWVGDGKTAGSYTSGPYKLVLHTTETPGIPGYEGGFTAPHITYLAKERKFVQHTSFLTAARSLVNQEGGVQTNRDSAIQLEIVAYSQESVVDQYPNTGRIKVSELTDEQLSDIREFILWVCAEFDVKFEWPGKQATSYGQANAAGFRMTNAEWDGFNGVCGHQHVPENLHWDPGALNWQALMEGVVTEAQMAELLSAINGVKVGVWSAQPGEPGVSAYQTLLRTKADTSAIRATLGSGVDLTDEDIAAIAAAISDEVGEDVALAIGAKLMGA